MSKNESNKLWIVTELFYPDQTSTSYILSKVADKMLEKYDVNVITSDSLYQKNVELNKSYFEISKNVNILRVKTGEFNKNKILQRIIRVILLTIKLSLLLFRKIKKGDKLFIVTNPAPLLVTSSWIKKIKKTTLYILVHDVFPENTIPSGIIKRPNSVAYKLLASIFNKAYSTADYIIVLGRDMKEIIKGKVSRSKVSPTIEIIENWGDIVNIRPRTDLNLIKERRSKGIVTLQYAGNVGRLQGLDRFLELLYKAGNKNVLFEIWGEGAYKDKLKGIVNQYQLNNQVVFHGNYSRDEQDEILNTADIALITLAKGMYGLGVPSKTYNIMAAGKPLFFIGDLESEIALLIQEEKIGYCYDPEDEDGLVRFLKNISTDQLSELREMSLNSRIVAENKFSESIILNKFLEIV